MRAALLTAALAAALVLAGPAQAHYPKTFPIRAAEHVRVDDRAEIDRAVANWKGVTGATACKGAHNIQLATHPFPSGRAWAHAHVSSCRIHFDAVKVPRMRALRGDQWLCVLVSHEVGHLAHRGHAERGIMSQGLITSHKWCREPRTESAPAISDRGASLPEPPQPSDRRDTS
jgi:hypothetical protein